MEALTSVLFPHGLSGPMSAGLSQPPTPEQLAEQQLSGWAIYQLVDLHTAAADHVLTLYFAAVDRLERDHPLHYEAHWQQESTGEKWKAYGKRD